MILRAKTCHGSAEGRGLIEHKRALEPAKVSLLESGVLIRRQWLSSRTGGSVIWYHCHRCRH
jgi:hypothetical protein